ncbi:MAG TPA: class I SAM-dependent methyltransferase [Haloplasmataceae bacterium]
MSLEKVLNFSHTLIKSCTKEGDIVIDATIGNGNDILFLSQIVKDKGKVFGFDIQDDAINNTKDLLKKYNCTNVTLFKQGHENLLSIIPKEYQGNISCGIFNLGYLPKGNKNITTKKDTTIKALESLLSILKINGIVVLVIYSGHMEGKIEKDGLLEYVKSLNQKDYQVLLYQFINQINDAPFLIAIEKMR